ncbi:MAG: AraC family transcriptional regulator, partial [Halopseudomonas aestusnigri]|nr:AraC family transcriptional regulator [Halopseudomonas aestusnigri]
CLPVSEIAARCGYGSQSAFTQAFRKHWQQSPSSLRKQH